MPKTEKSGSGEARAASGCGSGSGRLAAVIPPERKGPFVYILECRDGSLYTGWTIDLAARLAAHNGQAGAGKGAKCTRSRRPVRLVYFEEYDTKSEAMSRENAIKRLTREKKLELITMRSAMVSG